MKFIDKYLQIKAATPQETARLLTEHVQEVDKLETTGVIAQGVITGKIIDIQKHPNADRLRILTIDLGGDITDIVTASPNVSIDQIIPVAVPGARIRMLDHRPENEGKPITSHDLVIVKTVTLRGIESPGMICGPDEIGLSDTFTIHVHVFPDKTPLGVPIESIIQSKTVIETDDKGTAHRPDLLSYKGIEQELAAILHQPYERPFPLLPDKVGDLNVSIESTDACNLLLAARIERFSTMVSPQWLQQFLVDHDIKVVNLPADATNYIMLTEGGATHAFGAEHIRNNTIQVRFAHQDETIDTLNNRSYTLDKTDLVIADTNCALDIAGIIGGAHTGMSANSKSVILTSIVVDASVVRRTGRRLGIRTDALARRERGQSTASSINAFIKVVELLQREGGAKVTAFDYAGDVTLQSESITINMQHLNRFLATSLKPDDTESILKSLNYQVAESDSRLTVKPPWWRLDVHRAADVYEDIARIYGYNQIPLMVPRFDIKSIDKKDRVINILRQVAAQTMYEVQTSSMGTVKRDASLEVRNPIGNKKYIRQTLLPELFVLAERFTREGYTKYACFEIGKTYRLEHDHLQEKHRFCAVIVDDIEMAKSRIAMLLHRLHIPSQQVQFIPCDQSEQRPEHYDAVAKIYVGKTLLGNMCVNKRRGAYYSGFKLYIESLTEVSDLEPVFHHYSKYPVIKRDLSIIAKKDIELGQIVNIVRAKAPKLLQHIVLSEQNDDLPVLQAGERALTFHLEFQSHEGTLAADKIDGIMLLISRDLRDTYQITTR